MSKISAQAKCRYELAKALTEFVKKGGEAKTFCGIVNTLPGEGDERLRAAAIALRNAA